MNSSTYDALVIGGGPAGSTAAMVLARSGASVLVIEKAQFPRFHVGESFLPKVYDLLEELNLISQLNQIPHMPKFGAEFGFGHGDATTCFDFDTSLHGEGAQTFNIERAPFDAMLLDEARRAGAEVRTEMSVTRIVNLADGDVRLRLSNDEEVRGRVLLDAGGPATIVARHLGTRKPLRNHRKVAYFGHFQNCDRLPDTAEGHPTVAMCDEGWFWMIHIDAVRTSIGLVLDADVARHLPCPANRALQWGIERCPLFRERMSHAVFPETNHTVADFSYSCAPYSGPGYFLLGDAAFFIDPIFSSGACLGMMGGAKAAELSLEMLSSRHRSVGKLRREYNRFIQAGSTPFVRIVNLFYRHNFRELFLRGQGPFEVHRAIVSILGGHIFPRLRWSLRWRLWLLEQFTRIQRVYPLVDRQRPFSLLSEPAVQRSPLEQLSASA